MLYAVAGNCIAHNASYTLYVSAAAAAATASGLRNQRDDMQAVWTVLHHLFINAPQFMMDGIDKFGIERGWVVPAPPIGARPGPNTPPRHTASEDPGTILMWADANERCVLCVRRCCWSRGGGEPHRPVILKLSDGTFKKKQKNRGRLSLALLNARKAHTQRTHHTRIAHASQTQVSTRKQTRFLKRRYTSVSSSRGQVSSGGGRQLRLELRNRLVPLDQPLVKLSRLPDQNEVIRAKVWEDSPHSLHGLLAGGSHSHCPTNRGD